jgi:hypothetical protein
MKNLTYRRSHNLLDLWFSFQCLYHQIVETEIETETERGLGSRVVSWEASESGFSAGVLSELDVKIEDESFGVRLEEARKIEDEKERDGGVAEISLRI